MVNDGFYLFMGLTFDSEGEAVVYFTRNTLRILIFLFETGKTLRDDIIITVVILVF